MLYIKLQYIKYKFEARPSRAFSLDHAEKSQDNTRIFSFYISAFLKMSWTPYGVTAMSAILLTQHMTVLRKDTLPQSMTLNLGDMIKMMRIAFFDE